MKTPTTSVIIRDVLLFDPNYKESKMHEVVEDSNYTTVTTLSEKYSGTRWDFIGNSTNIGIEIFDIHFATDNITNPHQPISYFVLSKGIN